MQKCQVSFKAGMLGRIIEYYGESFEDEKVKMTLIEQSKLEAIYEVESEMPGEAAAAYLKDVFKKTKFGPALYFTVNLK